MAGLNVCIQLDTFLPNQCVTLGFFVPGQTTPVVCLCYENKKWVKCGSFECRTRQNPDPVLPAKPNIKLWFKSDAFTGHVLKPCPCADVCSCAETHITPNVFDSVSDRVYLPGARERKPEKRKHGEEPTIDSCIPLFHPDLQNITAESVLFGVCVYYKFRNNTQVPYARFQLCGKLLVRYKQLTAKKTSTFPVFLESAILDEAAVRPVSYLHVYTTDLPAVNNKRGGESLESIIRTCTQPAVKREFEFLKSIAPECVTQPRDQVEADEFHTLHRTRLAPACYPIDGLVHDAPLNPDVTFGVPVSGFFAFDPKAPPAVSPLWFVNRLCECLLPHGYNLDDFVKYHDVLVNGRSISDFVSGEDAQREFRHVMAMCIPRVMTMYSYSRPYLDDMVLSPDAEDNRADSVRVVSTDVMKKFASGDCEDGAATAYLISMTLLFCETLLEHEDAKHEDAKHNYRVRSIVTKMRQVHAVHGLPVCIGGLSRDVISNHVGVPHMFGAIVPIPRLIRAIYPTMCINMVKKAFRAKFGFHMPPLGDMRTLVLETTMIVTPQYGLHPNVSREVHDKYAIVKNVLDGLNKPTGAAIWVNFAYAHVLGETDGDQQFMRVCHSFSTRAFTDAHRHLLGAETPEHPSSSFVFCSDSECSKIATPYDDMFLHPHDRAADESCDGDKAADFPLYLVPTLTLTDDERAKMAHVLRETEIPLATVPADPADPFCPETPQYSIIRERLVRIRRFNSVEAIQAAFHSHDKLESPKLPLLQQLWPENPDVPKPRNNKRDEHVTVYTYYVDENTLSVLCGLFSELEAKSLHIFPHAFSLALVFRLTN